MGSRSLLYPSKLTDSLWFGEWFLSALSLEILSRPRKNALSRYIMRQLYADTKQARREMAWVCPIWDLSQRQGYRSGIQNQPFGIQTVIQKELSAGPGRTPGMLWRSTGPFCLDQFRHDLLVIFLGTTAGLKWLRSAEADLSFLRTILIPISFLDLYPGERVSSLEGFWVLDLRVVNTQGEWYEW